MEFEEAKKQLAKEWGEREAQWEEERKVRIAAGKPDGIDAIFERLESRGPRLLAERAYWRVRRPIEDVLRGYAYRSAKNRILRAKRGWGQQDWWGLSDYLSAWLPDALRELSEHSHGYPMEVVNHDGTLLYCLWEDKDSIVKPRVHSISSEDEDGAVRIWSETLERMAQGFEAFALLSDHAWRGETEAERELVRMRDEGLQLFVRNFGALWD